MKIAGLIFESLTKPGGYEIFTHNLLCALSGRGHEVDLYLPRRELRKHREFYEGCPFAVKPLMPAAPSLLKRSPGVVRASLVLAQKLRGYDVWQVMGAHPEATAARGLAGLVPLCMRAHGDDVQCDPAIGYGLRLDPALDRLIRLNMPLMDRVVALTPGIVGDMLELGAHPDNVRVIPNGISLAQYKKPRDRQAIRAELGLGDDDFCILTVGRNHRKKGFDLIPGIAAELKAQGRSFHWLVVGGGTDELAPELARLGVDDVVRPMKPIPVPPGVAAPDALPPERLVDLYFAADVFFFPSRLETFGRVILEAMAAGTPAITTDAPGCRDVAGMGEYARMVGVDDTEAMIHALVEFMDDAEVRTRFAEIGLQRAREHDWERVAREYENLYEELRPDS